jgi:hypothetical protein
MPLHIAHYDEPVGSASLEGSHQTSHMSDWQRAVAEHELTIARAHELLLSGNERMLNTPSPTLPAIGHFPQGSNMDNIRSLWHTHGSEYLWDNAVQAFREGEIFRETINQLPALRRIAQREEEERQRYLEAAQQILVIPAPAVHETQSQTYQRVRHLLPIIREGTQHAFLLQQLRPPMPSIPMHQREGPGVWSWESQPQNRTAATVIRRPAQATTDAIPARWNESSGRESDCNEGTAAPHQFSERGTRMPLVSARRLV